MQKTDHYKEINFHAGHRVTGGRVYAYFVSTMERLRRNGEAFLIKYEKGPAIDKTFILPILRVFFSHSRFSHYALAKFCAKWE